MEEIMKRLLAFRDERDWKQFHTPENLAKSIVIEGAELLENFQWNGSYDHQNVKEELADVMSYCMLLAEALDIDLVAAMHEKIDKNAAKYPADLVRGSSKKYNQIHRNKDNDN